ncbi:MAG: DUF2892 domain-containing protein [Thiobacillus sp.]|nr:DUF2892 domain-containing protein [Thiobacillus sp.]
MSALRIVRTVAGFFVLLSLALGMHVSPIFMDENWLWLAAFTGFNLFQSGFTNICPLEIVLKIADIK